MSDVFQAFASALGSLLGAALVLFFLRLWTGRISEDTRAIKKRMEKFEQGRHACQLGNAKDFATWEVVNRMDEKVGSLDGRVSRLEAKAD